MSKKGEPKDIIVGEIWSLLALIIVLLGILMYLSSDTLVVGTHGVQGEGKQIDIDAENSAKSVWYRFKTYVSDNRKAIVISGYIVLALLLVVLAVNLLLWNHRRVIFRQQNEVSRKKIREYQKSLKIDSRQ